MIQDPAAVCSLGWMVGEVGRMPGIQWFEGVAATVGRRWFWCESTKKGVPWLTTASSWEEAPALGRRTCSVCPGESSKA